jgi:hypothetical protein
MLPHPQGMVPYTRAVYAIPFRQDEISMRRDDFDELKCVTVHYSPKNIF